MASKETYTMPRLVQTFAAVCTFAGFMYLFSKYSVGYSTLIFLLLLHCGVLIFGSAGLP